MIKAVFLDFYGTVVHEDSEIVSHIVNAIVQTGKCDDHRRVASHWNAEFTARCNAAHGPAFIRQRELEHESLVQTLTYFHASLDVDKCCNQLFEHWMHPPLFDDARGFFDRCRVPIYIVSNIDTEDLHSALDWTGLSPEAIFTSEMARAYKPRPDVFHLALERLGLDARHVIHFGDSFKSDVLGAASAGITGVCVTRGRHVPDCQSVSGLQAALDMLPHI